LNRKENGMLPFRFYHRQVTRYFNPVKPNMVSLKLRVRPKSEATCQVWYLEEDWQPKIMYPFAYTPKSVYYQTFVTTSKPQLKYFFQLVCNGFSYWVGSSGVEAGIDFPEDLQPFCGSWQPEQVFVVPDWVQSAVFYQIFPERFYNGDPSNDPPNTEPWGGIPTRTNFFGGDLQGIAAKIRYLAELGVNAVWLNPIFASVSNHKYDTMDFRKVDPHFGDLATFDHLVDIFRQHQIKLVLDCVFNHTGDEFWAFEDIVQHGYASRYIDWYYIYDCPICKHPPNYACWWDFADLPKLNVKNPEVRKYLLETAALWTKRGADGWRLDVPNEVEHKFWQEFRQVVKGIDPETYIVGEIWRDGRPWLQGDQFDGVMNYLFRDLVIDCFAKDRIGLKTFDYLLGLIRLRYPEQVHGCLLNLLGSHDTARIITEFISHLPHGLTEKEAYQTAKDRLRPALIFQMTYLGAPMVYYGDEVGMTGGPDPGCRSTMGWVKDCHDQELFSLYKTLITIRHKHPVLKTGTFETLFADDHRGLYYYLRRNEQEIAIVVLNKHQELHGLVITLPQVPPDIVFSDCSTGYSYPVSGNQLALPRVQGFGGIILTGEL